MSNLEMQFKNYRLTTAHILYHMPDHPSLLQEYIWQELDLAPQFPVLTKFLRFWQGNLDGKLYAVRVAHNEIIKAAEFRVAGSRLYLN